MRSEAAFDGYIAGGERVVRVAKTDMTEKGIERGKLESAIWRTKVYPQTITMITH